MAEPTSTLRDGLRQRRTIHDFRPDVPAWPLVLAALESACLAPNHYFTQPWRFYRLGQQTRQSVIELNARLVAASKGAGAAEKKRQRWASVPGWLVVTSKISPNPLTSKEDYAATCCAVQNLMLDLWASGIGCKWTTGAVTRHAEFYRLLGAKRHQEEVVALLWYGYPARIPKALRSAAQSKLTQLP